MEFTPISGACGAEVSGIDLERDLTPERVEALTAGLGEYGVLVFRGQTLSPEDHLAMGEAFGGVNINRFFKAVDGHPGIAEVRKEPDQKANIGGQWHTDHTYDIEPALGSILVARELPPFGGDTLFSSMYAAYDALSDGMKAMLSGMKAVHSSRHVFGTSAYYLDDGSDLAGRYGNNEAATQDAVHPVVIRHPVSGRPSLYVNSGFTIGFDGWTAEESRPLLEMLYEHGSRPEFTCRVRFEPGTVVFWDNRATWHFALNDYAGHRRLMHRVTVEGAPLPAWRPEAQDRAAA